MSVISTHDFCRFWPVSWTITHHFLVPKRFPRLTNPRVRLRVVHQHSKFWPILARFVDCYSLFWGPRVISTIKETWVRLRVGHQHLPFWLILARFVDYYTLFWGPRVSPTIDEPQGALTCLSSTPVVLAGSGPFRGLLLTVLVSQSGFHD